MEDKKKAIFVSARNLFYSKGFKDTNIFEIAQDAGIGVGTFYNYYSSKEEIFLKVFIEEDMKFKHSMFERVDPDDDLVTVSSKIMMQYIDNMHSNRILGEWYNRDLFSKLERYFYQQNDMQKYNDFMHNDIANLIKKWKSEGKLRKDIDDDLILAILYSVVYVDMHKTEIGIQYFPKMISLLYEFIMKGLTERQK
jgi:AcrR family transcriptional regulator